MNLKVISIITMAVLVIGQYFSYPVFAQDYTVSGNGEGSSNSININKDNSQTVEQKNEAEVNNNVEAKSNTGGNEISDNSSQSNVETGDSSSEVVIENSGNTNIASGNCCPSSADSSTQITGNGSGSNNQIEYNQDTNTTVTQNSSARINNNISINANTGDNEAFGNSGDVSIATGNVNLSVGISNDLNFSYISLPKQTNSPNLKILGNGSGSDNKINQDILEDEQFFVDNYLELSNNIKTFANTGGNKANKNNGKVFIATGSVYLDLLIINKGNISKIIADCARCQKPSPPASPAPTPPPNSSPSPFPPSGGECCSPTNSPPGLSESGGGGESSPGSPGGGGQVLGETLPGTGGFSLIQAAMLALMGLGSGIILKLDFRKSKKYGKKLKRNLLFKYIQDYKDVAGKFVNYNFPLHPPRNLLTRFTGIPAKLS